ncbi:MAG: flagellar hook-basal body complex protein FliE [Planctomycetaceae bacterium]|jgi:flagellar hook-basal body complex protein FliE|nr:flagellar hook-basal body complex protein FliE [Planctomycetaceae bacterium]MDR1270714.1 flagellar hook-basal body complex protein FliE [Planctomycetaceae bacterium]
MDGISYLYGGVGRIGQLEARQGMGRIGFKMDPDRPMTAEEIKKTSFKDLLLGGIGEVNMMQQRADQAVEKLMTGGEIGMAEVLTAVQKADIAFKMMMQMRNKFVQAYQEIQNIRV